ncbi:MAG: STAS domain-containing protein [Gammaproteobacteria bacterium]|nr:STAS domain-containing protein [Gammaproteobacteria bacterium]
MSAAASRTEELRPISGPLVFDTVTGVYAASKGWFAGNSDLAFDLAGVTDVDSAGLGLVVEWLRLARASGQVLRFVNIPGQMKVLASVNGLQGILFQAAGT